MYQRKSKSPILVGTKVKSKDILHTKGEVVSVTKKNVELAIDCSDGINNLFVKNPTRYEWFTIKQFKTMWEKIE
jgi:hypothetical protein